jgi:hypothetical protein
MAIEADPLIPRGQTRRLEQKNPQLNNLPPQHHPRLSFDPRVPVHRLRKIYRHLMHKLLVHFASMFQALNAIVGLFMESEWSAGPRAVFCPCRSRFFRNTASRSSAGIAKFNPSSRIVQWCEATTRIGLAARRNRKRRKSGPSSFGIRSFGH